MKHSMGALGISHGNQIERSQLMNNLKTVVAIAVGSLFAGAAFAQSNYSIEQRDRIEQQRIDRGVQSGQLTSREADRLQGERAQIERMESRARSDGVMTRNERARIDGAQDRLSRDIRRESNDRQTSNGYGRQYDNRGNGWGRGNDNGRGHDFGRGNDNGRGHDFGRGNDQRQFGNRDGGRGDHNTTHAGTTTPGTGTSTGTGNGHGWTQHAGNGTGTTTGTGTGTTTGTGNNHGSTPRTGTTTHASMPQAQVRSTQTQASRQVSMASQGGNSGHRTR
jgi:hypothetical protein